MKLGLNLSRGKPAKYYSSDRIAQLLGNGLLTFIDKQTHFNDLIGNDSVIYYSNIDDLSYKINKYKKDTKQAKKIAKKGRDDKIERYFVSKLLPVFLNWMTLKIIKPIDVIKKYIGSITPSINPKLDFYFV